MLNPVRVPGQRGGEVSSKLRDLEELHAEYLTAYADAVQRDTAEDGERLAERRRREEAAVRRAQSLAVPPPSGAQKPATGHNGQPPEGNAGDATGDAKTESAADKRDTTAESVSRTVVLTVSDTNLMFGLSTNEYPRSVPLCIGRLPRQYGLKGSQPSPVGAGLNMSLQGAPSWAAHAEWAWGLYDGRWGRCCPTPPHLVQEMGAMGVGDVVGEEDESFDIGSVDNELQVCGGEDESTQGFTERPVGMADGIRAFVADAERRCRQSADNWVALGALRRDVRLSVKAYSSSMRRFADRTYHMAALGTAAHPFFTDSDISRAVAGILGQSFSTPSACTSGNGALGRGGNKGTGVVGAVPWSGPGHGSQPAVSQAAVGYGGPLRRQSVHRAIHL